MLKRLKPVLFTLILGAVLTACGQQEAVKPQPTPPQTEQPQPPTQPNLTYAFNAPLTGLGTNEQLPGRPVMVMINNLKAARPQSGLDKADIVYEVLAEGEVTRFLAVYHSQKPEMIGPVRSIRPYFIQIGSGFHALLVHAGGSPEALETLAHADYGNINEISNGKYFWREKFRKAPHNLYTNLDKIAQAAADKGMKSNVELPQFTFLPEDATVTDGQPASKIAITYHPKTKASYTYDEASKKYLRFTDGQPHIDMTTKAQLSCTNLLVIAAKHQILDSEGRRHVDVVGPGDGYLFRQGKAVKIKWKRSGGVIRAYADASLTQEIPLLTGNTWVNIVPNVPSLDSHVTFQ